MDSLALPARPEDVVPGETKGGDEDGKPVGAHIELQVQPPGTGLWAVVQWQDSSEGWHDVEGWRNTLDEHGYRRWWVDAKDFGAEPFRWVVYQTPEGAALGISEPFSLPLTAGQVVPVVALVDIP